MRTVGTTSRLKIAASLLLTAACVRLIVSNLDLYMYGDFKVPMHMQLELAYPILVAAIIVARSSVACLWVFAVVFTQVLFTFVLCYTLPRTLASVLEIRIPYIAVSQFAVAAVLLAALIRYDKTTRQRSAA